MPCMQTRIELLCSEDTGRYTSADPSLQSRIGRCASAVASGLESNLTTIRQRLSVKSSHGRPLTRTGDRKQSLDDCTSDVHKSSPRDSVCQQDCGFRSPAGCSRVILLQHISRSAQRDPVYKWCAANGITTRADSMHARRADTVFLYVTKPSRAWTTRRCMICEKKEKLHANVRGSRMAHRHFCSACSLHGVTVHSLHLMTSSC